MIIIHPQQQCYACAHYTGPWTPDKERNERHVCKAFPERIPGEILRNEVDHRKPFTGDNGITFELRPGETNPLD